MQEEWRDVVGYEGYYQVSNLGNVKRMTSVVRSCLKHLNGFKTVKEHNMKLNLTNKYLSVCLHKNGVLKYKRVHRLVAEAFIPNPQNLEQINHKDENKLNNCADNLEWCSCKYNQNYGTRKEKREHSQVKEIQKIDPNTNKVLETYFSLMNAAKMNGLSFRAISRCATGKSKTSGGFIWKYTNNIEEFGALDKVVENTLIENA